MGLGQSAFPATTPRLVRFRAKDNTTHNARPFLNLPGVHIRITKASATQMGRLPRQCHPADSATIPIRSCPPLFRPGRSPAPPPAIQRAWPPFYFIAESISTGKALPTFKFGGFDRFGLGGLASVPPVLFRPATARLRTKFLTLAGHLKTFSASFTFGHRSPPLLRNNCSVASL